MSQPGPSTRKLTRPEAPARNASPLNPLSVLEDENDIEEVVRIQPPPEDLDPQDFKSIKIDRLIVLEGFKNYERWAQKLNMIFKVLDARDVVINGYQPSQGASAVALRTYKHIERNSLLLLLQVISEPIMAQIARQETSHQVWHYLRKTHYKGSPLSLVNEMYTFNTLYGALVPSQSIKRESPSGKRSKRGGEVKLARQRKEALQDLHPGYRRVNQRIPVSGGRMSDCGREDRFEGIARTEQEKQRGRKRRRPPVGTNSGIHEVTYRREDGRAQLGNGRAAVSLDASTSKRPAFLRQSNWRTIGRVAGKEVSLPGATPKTPRQDLLGPGVNNTNRVYLPPHKREGMKDGNQRGRRFGRSPEARQGGTNQLQKWEQHEESADSLASKKIEEVSLITKYIPLALRQKKQPAPLDTNAETTTIKNEPARRTMQEAEGNQGRKSVPQMAHESSPEGRVHLLTAEISLSGERSGAASAPTLYVQVPIPEYPTATPPIDEVPERVKTLQTGRRHISRNNWAVLRPRLGLERATPDAVGSPQTKVAHELRDRKARTIRSNGLAVNEAKQRVEDQFTDDYPTICIRATQPPSHRQSYASALNSEGGSLAAELRGDSGEGTAMNSTEETAHGRDDMKNSEGVTVNHRVRLGSRSTGSPVILRLRGGAMPNRSLGDMTQAIWPQYLWKSNTNIDSGRGTNSGFEARSWRGMEQMIPRGLPAYQYPQHNGNLGGAQLGKMEWHIPQRRSHQHRGNGYHKDMGVSPTRLLQSPNSGQHRIGKQLDFVATLTDGFPQESRNSVRGKQRMQGAQPQRQYSEPRRTQPQLHTDLDGYVYGHRGRNASASATPRVIHPSPPMGDGKRRLSDIGHIHTSSEFEGQLQIFLLPFPNTMALTQ